MAHTVELLALIEAYPEAFLEPTDASLSKPSATVTQASENSDLMSLMTEFPEAFALSDELTPSAELTPSMAQAKSIEDVTEPESPTAQSTMIEAPTGYEMALHQPIATFGWGQVDVFLRYGEQGLRSIWIVVGKSGTEVQSFCEAIARLTNRLLSVGTPISELVKELRGIRGGDSEGLGPHRFLGLVDLFGKVLQDAPETMAVPVQAPAIQPDVVAPPVQSASPEPSQPKSSNGHTPSSTSHQWVELSDTSAIASICPECGAELHQVNGCSGGACVVCGYSSCS